MRGNIQTQTSVVCMLLHIHICDNVYFSGDIINQP